MSLSSGDSTDGDSGSLAMETGHATGGTGGDIVMRVGSADTGVGDIVRVSGRATVKI